MSLLQFFNFLMDIRQAHAEKFFARIHLVYLHRQKLLVNFMFKCRCILAFNQRMNIEFKRHASIAKFIYPLLRVGSPCLTNLIYAFTERANI